MLLSSSLFLEKVVKSDQLLRDNFDALGFAFVVSTKTRRLSSALVSFIVSLFVFSILLLIDENEE